MSPMDTRNTCWTSNRKSEKYTQTKPHKISSKEHNEYLIFVSHCTYTFGVTDVSIVTLWAVITLITSRFTNNHNQSATGHFVFISRLPTTFIHVFFSNNIFIAE